jgi:peptidylprolyl isomerase
MIKILFVLPFLAFTLIAAKDPLPPPPKPPVSLTAPAEVAADPANKWTLELSNGGKVVIQLRPDVAPQTVYRIQLLTTQGFYDGLKFHRVIPGFMAQGGDPQGTGAGGSKLPDLKAEFNDLPHMRGVVSMARTDEPNTANSQFFIMLAPTFKLDHKYSGFGRVIEGMAAVDGIAVGEPPESPTTIVHASIGGPLPAAPPPPVVAETPAPEAAPAAAAPVPEVAPAPTPAVETPAPETAPPAAAPAPEAAPTAAVPANQVPAPAVETPAPVPTPEAETPAPGPADPAAAPTPAPEAPAQETPPPTPQ